MLFLTEDSSYHSYFFSPRCECKTGYLLNPDGKSCDGKTS